jgi:hypothetical protein
MKLYKLNFLRLFLVAIMVTSYIPGLLGMENDKEKLLQENTISSANILLNGGFPTTPFHHLTTGRMLSSPSLIVKRSNFIRKTFFDIHEFSTLNNKSAASFSELYTSIIQCFVLCQNFDHTATSFFRDQKENFSSLFHGKNRYKIDIRESIKDSFELFLKSLKDKEDIDSIDLYLMGHLILRDFTQEEAFEKTEKLSNLNRNEIAIYYLMNFAFLSSYGGAGPYYKKAKKLGCAEAGAKLRELDKYDQEIFDILKMKPQGTPPEINMLEDSDSLTIPL